MGSHVSDRLQQLYKYEYLKYLEGDAPYATALARYLYSPFVWSARNVCLPLVNIYLPLHVFVCIRQVVEGKRLLIMLLVWTSMFEIGTAAFLRWVTAYWRVAFWGTGPSSLQVSSASLVQNTPHEPRLNYSSLDELREVTSLLLPQFPSIQNEIVVV